MELGIILKWNEAVTFHSDAPETLIKHASILDKNTHDKYVWWGKVSKTGYLGITKSDVPDINEYIRTHSGYMYLFLYCPDSPSPTMHVGKMIEISTENQISSSHTPSYYQDIGKTYKVPFWFKLTDICKVPIDSTLKMLKSVNKEKFDPVSVNFYPQKVLFDIDPNYFLHDNMYINLLDGRKMRCFKTGGICSRESELIYHPNRVFIGCPFRDEFLNMVEYVVKPACIEKGYEPWIATEAFSNIDLMCKVCGAIQTSGKAIIDLTDWNANALFELGLLYGLGKKVFLLLQKNKTVPVDLNGLEYIIYDMYNFAASKETLLKYLQ